MFWRRVFAAILFGLTSSAVLVAQPPGVMPARTRISPSNAPDISLYMLLSRRADRVLWSPGGSLLAVVDSVDIDLYRVTDWQLPPLNIRLDQPLTDLIYSPDGRTLYTLAPGSVVAWNTADGAIRERFVADARRIAVSPDGTRLALLARQNIVQVVNAATRETFSVTPSVAADDVAFSRDGSRIFVSDGAGGGELIDLALRQTERVFPGGAAPTVGLLTSVLISGDGRYIVSQAAEEPDALWLWDARTGERSGAMNRPAEFQRVYGWGLNARTGIAVGAGIGRSPEQSAALIWPMSGGEPLARLRHPGVRDAQPSPDGTLIATVGGGTLRLWAAADSLPLPEQAALLSQVNVVAACDVFNVRPSPGEVLDGQTVSLVWSWYAAAARQVRDYLDAAIFRLDLDGINIRPWIFVTQTLPDELNQGNPTVYLYAPARALTRGQHVSQLAVTWVQPISDGFADFGPGTANPADGGACTFTVR